MSVLVASPFDMGDRLQRESSNTCGPGALWRGLSIIDSPRYRELDRKLQYFDCTQHDGKGYDFDGRAIGKNQSPLGNTQPVISLAQAPFYVPLRMRRPSAPYRLSRVISLAFTGLIFGEGRFPRMSVLGDLATEDYAGALVKACRLPAKMVQARNYGGACGTAALSWSFKDGRPRVAVLNPKSLFVHSWDDREELIPRHVTRAYLYGRDEWDEGRKRFVRAYYWYRKDWTPNADIVFKPLRFQPGVDPAKLWEPDPANSVVHGDRSCHVVWIQNAPADDVDGDADSDGQWENFDELDIILSIILRGAKLNLDPTLVLKADRALVERLGIKKGSDNALIVDPDGGDAKYLELAGTSLEAGIKVFNEHRKTILDATQCVIPDPDKIAAAGTSSVALKMVYKPMLSAGEVLRDQYGQGISRLLEDMLVVVRRGVYVTFFDADKGAMVEDEEQEVDLPPRVEQETEVDGDGVPTGEMVSKVYEREPGSGEEVSPEWPQWFPLTPTDIQVIVAAHAQAVPNTAIMSQQSAVEGVAVALGRDPREEWSRMQKQTADAKAEQDQMFADADGSAGGRVQHTQQLPSGAKVTRSLGPKPTAPPGKGGDDGDEEDLDAPPDDSK